MLQNPNLDVAYTVSMLPASLVPLEWMSKSKLLGDGMLLDLQGIALVMASDVTRNCRGVWGLMKAASHERYGIWKRYVETRNS